MSELLIDKLRASRLFGSADEPLLERLAAASSLKQLGPGEPIWRTGDRACAFTLIQRGLVQICKPLSDGEYATLALFGPRESIGDTAVLDRGVYPAAAIAASEQVEVLRVEAAVVLDALDHDVRLGQAMNRALIAHTRALEVKIAVMTAGPVSRRLATLLLHLGERFGDEDERGRLHIPLSLSRGELARLVGARVETVIRAVSAWQRKGWMATRADGLELTRADALARVAAGQT